MKDPQLVLYRLPDESIDEIKISPGESHILEPCDQRARLTHLLAVLEHTPSHAAHFLTALHDQECWTH